MRKDEREIISRRALNILRKALDFGFEIQHGEEFNDEVISAEKYLIDNSPHLEEECEVISLGQQGQRVDWEDSNGYKYWSQGEIINFKDHWYKAPGTKVIHSTVVNYHGEVVDLYYTVKENFLNT